jgi:hypothetical protein
MKLTKLAAVILPLALLTACANTAEMDALKASVAAVELLVVEALAAAQTAQSTADIAFCIVNDVELIANSAKTTAEAAQASVDECCAKIDRMFEKAMSK